MMLMRQSAVDAFTFGMTYDHEKSFINNQIFQTSIDMETCFNNFFGFFNFDFHQIRLLALFR